MSKLKAQLTGFSLTMVVIGSCVGSGIFKTPAEIASHLPQPLWILLVWLLGGIVTVAGALAYAELSSMFPRAGGLYVFLKEAYGDLVGYLYGWANLTVIVTGAIAALSLIFAEYLGGNVLGLGEWGQKAMAICGIFCLTYLNVRGVKLADLFANSFTIIKIVGVLLIILVGLVWGNSQLSSWTWASEFTPQSDNTPLTAFGLALVGVVFSFGGFQHATFLAGEAKNPSRTVPRAMVLGTTAVTVLYLLVNVAYMFLLPMDAMIASSGLAAEAVSQVITTGGILVALLIALSTFGTAGIYTLSAPRIYFAMASDQLFFPWVARIHKRYNTPINAIILQSSWAIILLLFWGTFSQLITFLVFVEWIFLSLAAFSVVVWRIRKPELVRGYKTLGYPITPFIFVGIALFILGSTLISRPEEAGAGLTLLALGLPIYYYFKRKKTAHE